MELSDEREILPLRSTARPDLKGRSGPQISPPTEGLPLHLLKEKTVNGKDKKHEDVRKMRSSSADTGRSLV